MKIASLLAFLLAVSLAGATETLEERKLYNLVRLPSFHLTLRAPKAWGVSSQALDHPEKDQEALVKKIAEAYGIPLSNEELLQGMPFGKIPGGVQLYTTHLSEDGSPLRTTVVLLAVESADLAEYSRSAYERTSRIGGFDDRRLISPELQEITVNSEKFFFFQSIELFDFDTRGVGMITKHYTTALEEGVLHVTAHLPLTAPYKHREGVEKIVSSIRKEPVRDAEARTE